MKRLFLVLAVCCLAATPHQFKPSGKAMVKVVVLPPPAVIHFTLFWDYTANTFNVWQYTNLQTAPVWIGQTTTNFFAYYATNQGTGFYRVSILFYYNPTNANIHP